MSNSLSRSSDQCIGTLGLEPTSTTPEAIDSLSLKISHRVGSAMEDDGSIQATQAKDEESFQSLRVHDLLSLKGKVTVITGMVADSPILQSVNQSNMEA